MGTLKRVITNLNVINCYIHVPPSYYAFYLSPFQGSVVYSSDSESDESKESEID